MYYIITSNNYDDFTNASSFESIEDAKNELKNIKMDCCEFPQFDNDFFIVNESGKVVFA